MHVVERDAHGYSMTMMIRIVTMMRTYDGKQVQGLHMGKLGCVLEHKMIVSLLEDLE